MIKNLADYIQVMKDVDNGHEADQAMEDDCLRNPVIVRKILEHFPGPDLRQLSLVNKLWKCEAQSLMRKRGQLTAYVKAHDYDPNHPRGVVDAFISDLQQMKPVPFSAISIDIIFEGAFVPSPAQDPLQGVVLDLSLLKTVSVRLQGYWSDNMTSSGVLLIKKLLQDCSGVLEELLLHIVDGPEDFIEKFLQDVTFPRLKILKLRENNYNDKTNEVDYENYMKTLLSRAPNLSVLHSDWSINLMLRVLEGRAILPVYGSRVGAPFEEISEDIISAIKLEQMELVCSGYEYNFERINRIAPMLLQESCSTTLRYMWLDAVLAVPLMTYGISLKNVKHLNMIIDFSRLEHEEPRILGIVKNFDFSRIFPNLNKVDITALGYISLGNVDGIVQQATAVLTDPTLDRAANVNTLYLNQRNLSNEAIQFFAEMFPSIENLEVDPPADAQIPFGSIWSNWLELKELKIRGPTSGNLDSIFCGISPEEVAELSLKDDDYLKSVNIVPVMPALTGLKNLRTLFLNRVEPDDATFLFSKVTLLLAFARLPALAVRLNIAARARTVPPAMTHLEPYVSVTSDFIDDSVWWYY